MATDSHIEVLEMTQNAALRIIPDASPWTKICTMQAETKIPPITTRANAVQSDLLAKIIRTPQNADITNRLRQAMLQNDSLFVKKIWAMGAAKSNKKTGLAETILNLKDNKPHPDYSPPPPWQLIPIKITAQLPKT